MAIKQFQVVLEWSEEDHVWVTYVPTLNYLSTYGDTREEALANTEEAIIGYIEAAAKEGIPLPPSDGKAELVQIRVAVADPVAFDPLSHCYPV